MLPSLRPWNVILGAVVVASAIVGACGRVTNGDGNHVEVRASDECVTCHRSDYEKAKDPPHLGVFPETCGTCHSQTAWSPAKFHHPWALEGAHTTVKCASCHVGNPPVYEGTPKDCVGCHKADYDKSPYPGHQSFPLTCNDCHSTAAWKPAATSKHPFPLDGGHASVACSSCHVGNPPVYKGTPNTCVGCHKADYDASPYPGHQGFPTTCTDCHTTAAWKPASQSKHPFPLDGAHASTACTSCHVGDPPVYKGTPNTCVGCHKSDYDGSPYPGHQSFPTTCTDCHTTAAWKPATGGGHPEDAFPLVGSSGTHNMPCADCHKAALGPNGKGNTDCVGCHTGAHALSEMNGVHSAVNDYPTSSAPNFCLDCHPKGKAGN